MDNLIGKRLDGRYSIESLVGVGGMANVYRGTDLKTGNQIAVKVLKDEFLDNEELVRRFKNESKAISILSHPNIVKVYDVSVTDKLQYIVMEYVDGITLKEYLKQRGGALTWKETVHFATQILSALQHAHSKGIIHRDVKPQNIMLLADGSIKVFDTSTFTVDGKTLTSAFALDTDGDFTPDSEEAVFDGAFHESYFQSAPYFAIQIDGIEWLNSAF